MFKKSSIISFVIVLLIGLVVFFLISSRQATAPSSKQEVDFILQPVNNSQPGSYLKSIEDKLDDFENIIPGGLTKPKDKDSGYISTSDTVNIRVFKPQEGKILSSPFVIQGEARLSSPARSPSLRSDVSGREGSANGGQARIFEGTINIRVTNQQGKILIKETAQARSRYAGEFSPFKITISYQFSQTKEGFVEIYSISPRDGSEENLVKIPVKFE